MKHGYSFEEAAEDLLDKNCETEYEVGEYLRRISEVFPALSICETESSEYEFFRSVFPRSP